MKRGTITINMDTAARIIVVLMISFAFSAAIFACNGKTDLPSRRVVKKKVQKSAVSPQNNQEDFSVLADSSKSGYVYQRRDRRYPFIPLIRPSSQKQKKEFVTGTLESYDINEFKLSAIARRGSTYFALLVTPDNRSFTVRRGMRIGLNKGKVKEVSRNRVVLVEYARDYRGELKPRQITLEFNKGEDK